MNTIRRERRVARKYGGRRRPASGALPGLKRDVRRAGVFLMEHKSTEKDHYRFDVRDFLYLTRQCTDPLPVYLVEIRGTELALVPFAAAPRFPIISTKYSTRKLTAQAIGEAVKFEAHGITLSILSGCELESMLTEETE